MKGLIRCPSCDHMVVPTHLCYRCAGCRCETTVVLKPADLAQLKIAPVFTTGELKMLVEIVNREEEFTYLDMRSNTVSRLLNSIRHKLNACQEGRLSIESVEEPRESLDDMLRSGLEARRMEILSHVRSGRLSAEEAKERLESLDTMEVA